MRLRLSCSESVLKRFVPACLLFVLALGGCQKAHTSAESGPYAGLASAIAVWHRDIETQPACGIKPAKGHACQNFNIECKVSLDLEPGKAGETARLVAAMSWDEWNVRRADYDSASGGAIFTRTNGIWARTDINGPINLATCATS